MNLDSQLQRPCGQDIRELLTANAEAASLVLDRLLALDIHDLAGPAERLIKDLARALRVVVAQAVKQIIRERDTPSAGDLCGVPFIDCDDVPWITQFH
jgi:hypothetical protein